MEEKPDSVNILGVRVDKVNMDQAVGIVKEWLEEKAGLPCRQAGRKHYIVTPNIEFVMAAENDQQFREILNKADLAIPDSSHFGLPPLPGVDLMERLCEEAARSGFTVGFLGGRDGVAEKAADCLQKKYPGLIVSLAESGGEVSVEGKSLKLLKLPLTDILFVAFGQVKQEKWIVNNLDNIPVKVAMGVGGAFDYLAGAVPRAPLWMRKLGLEWLFRLIIQPWRIKRQLCLLKFIRLRRKTQDASACG